MLALSSPYGQHINTRRKPGQGSGKLMFHAGSLNWCVGTRETGISDTGQCLRHATHRPPRRLLAPVGACACVGERQHVLAVPVHRD